MSIYDDASRTDVFADLQRAASIMGEVLDQIQVPPLDDIRQRIEQAITAAHSASGVAALAGDASFYKQGQRLERHLRLLGMALFDLERLGTLAGESQQCFLKAADGIKADDAGIVSEATRTLGNLLEHQTAQGVLGNDLSLRDHPIFHDETIDALETSLSGNEPAPLDQPILDENGLNAVRGSDDGFVFENDLETPTLSGLAPKESSSGVDFDFDFTAESTADDQASEDEEDTAQLFTREVNELLQEVSGYLADWQANNDQAHAVQRLERIAHTIKGSAAIVGLQLIADMGKEQQERLGKIIGAPSIPHSIFEATIAGFSAIATALGLTWAWIPTARVVAVYEPKPSPGEVAVLDVLHEESVEALTLAWNHRAQGNTDRIRDDFHRIMGSALVLGHQVLADAAAKVVRSIQEGVSPDEALILIASILGVTGPLTSPPPGIDMQKIEGDASHMAEAVSAPLTPSTRTDRSGSDELFQGEALELIHQLTAEVLRFTDGSQVAVDDAKRTAHTLKGTAYTLGFTDLGQAIGAFETGLESIDPMRIALVARRFRRALSPIAEAINQWDFAGISAASTTAILNGGMQIQTVQASDPATELGIGAGIGATHDESHHSGGSGSHGSRASGTGSRGSGSNSLARRFLRVPAARLATLMTQVGELIIARGRISGFTQHLKPELNHLSQSRERLAKLVEQFSSRHEFTLLDQSRSKESGDNRQIQSGSDFSEIELDQYTDLNILARQLQEVGSDIDEAHKSIDRMVNIFKDEAGGFSTLIADLQAGITSARLVAIGSLFDRMRMPILDAADQENKTVAPIFVGGSVELDKLIVDDLYAPILHLVRNAVSHGIEADRAAVGKPAAGNVRIEAVQDAGAVVITIVDDGAGIDRKRLHVVGVAKGLIDASVPVDAPQVLDLIFSPGLSTKTEVTAISGRGIGGDVAKREIENLGGTIEVTSTAGVGTTITIRVPVSVSIIRSLLIQVGDQRYAVPLHGVIAVGSFLNAPPQAVDIDAQVTVAGVHRPLVDLGAIVGVGDPENRSELIVIRGRTMSLALAIDAVLGTDEVVVKGTGALVGRGLISSLTIMGDGMIVPILDPDGLVTNAMGRHDAAIFRNQITLAARQREQASAQIIPERVSLADSWFTEVETQTSAPEIHPVHQEATVALVEPPSESSVAILADKSDQKLKDASRSITNPNLYANSPTPPTVDSAPAFEILAAKIRRPGKPRILFIDDSLSARTQGKRLLQSAGYEVTVANDGEDGLKKLHEVEDIDLVFTDLEMPRKNGYQVLSEIRASARFASLPVVLVTSRIGDSHREKAEHLGVSAYLGKPFDKEILVAQVDRFVVGS
jgi:chemotaxis protein histidine kinase CheA/CheY-like chemotaxis protein